MRVTETLVQDKAHEIVSLLEDYKRVSFAPIQTDPVWSQVGLLSRAQKPYAALKSLVLNAGFFLKAEEASSMEPRYAGYCSHKNKIIAVQRMLSLPLSTHVLAHEVCHMRLDRIRGENTVPFKEQRAELCAMLFSHFILGVIPSNSYGYLAYYRNPQAPDVVGASNLAFQLMKQVGTYKPAKVMQHSHAALGTMKPRVESEDSKNQAEIKRLKAALSKLSRELDLYVPQTPLWLRAKGREQTLQGDLNRVLRLYKKD